MLFPLYLVLSSFPLHTIAIKFVRIIVPDPKLEVLMYELHQSWIVVRYKSSDIEQQPPLATAYKAIQCLKWGGGATKPTEI